MLDKCSHVCLVFAYIQYYSYSLLTFNFTRYIILGTFSCVKINFLLISLFVFMCCWYSFAVLCPALLSANNLCCDRRWGCPMRFDSARIPLLTTLFIHKTETSPRAVRVARRNTGSLKRARMPLRIATRLTGSDDFEASRAAMLFRGCDELDSDLGI